MKKIKQNFGQKTFRAEVFFNPLPGSGFGGPGDGIGGPGGGFNDNRRTAGIRLG